MDTDASGRIISFLEKPENPPCVPGRPDISLASMGIYVCNAEFLYDSLVRDARDEGSTHDFGRDFIPRFVNSAKLYAHEFSKSCQRSGNEHGSYWRDVGTLDAYWEASLDLTSVTPELDLYDPNWRIFTHSSQLAPAKFVFDDEGRRGTALDSVVSEGVIVSGAEVRRSLLSSQARVNSFARLEEAVILPEVNIGRHARLSKVIVDRGVSIPEGLVVGEDHALDARRFERTAGGVCLITAEMIAALD
jgi:glucose-1-phosphate adenylyltransferase